MHCVANGSKEQKERKNKKKKKNDDEKLLGLICFIKLQVLVIRLHMVGIIEYRIIFKVLGV